MDGWMNGKRIQRSNDKRALHSNFQYFEWLCKKKEILRKRFSLRPQRYFFLFQINDKMCCVNSIKNRYLFILFSDLHSFFFRVFEISNEKKNSRNAYAYCIEYMTELFYALKKSNKWIKRFFFRGNLRVRRKCACVFVWIKEKKRTNRLSNGLE